MFLPSNTRYFCCRTCAYMVTARFNGQWHTLFPPCRNCGPVAGRMDVLDILVRVSNDRAVLPAFDTEYLTSRFGEGTEPLRFKVPRHPWSWRWDGAIEDAFFRCRQCGSQKRGIYKGQWYSAFPLCDSRHCAETGGRMDCLEWHGADLVSNPPADCRWLSSRFGVGTEILPSVSLSIVRHRERSRSPDRGRSPYRSRLPNHSRYDDPPRVDNRVQFARPPPSSYPTRGEIDEHGRSVYGNASYHSGRGRYLGYDNQIDHAVPPLALATNQPNDDGRLLEPFPWEHFGTQPVQEVHTGGPYTSLSRPAADLEPRNEAQ